MSLEIFSKEQQAYGAFNGGEIVENKPIGFGREGGELRPYSNLFYWAFAEAKVDSTIGLHPHQGFEIMSFVLNGQIRHYDTAGKEWIPLEKGAVQIIRAGSGISHAEFMAKDAQMFQIWFDPGLQKTMQQAASYDDYSKDQFAVNQREGYQEMVLVGKDGPIQMDSPDIEIAYRDYDAGIFNLAVGAEEILSAYILQGDAQVNGEHVAQDAFIKASNESIKLEFEQTTKLFIVRTPVKVNYPTYHQIMAQQA